MLKRRQCRVSLWAGLTLMAAIAAVCGTAVAAPIAPPLPATAWLLDEGTGTGLSEWTGFRTGQLAGTTLPTWSTDTPFAYAGNHSLSFVPSGSSLGNYARLDGHPSPAQGTISFWVTDNGTGGPKYILDASGSARTLLYRSSAANALNYYQNNSHVGALTPDVVPTDGTWTHMAIVWDNSLPTGKQKVYKNGALFQPFNTSIGAVNPAYVYLGSRQSTNECWDGKIDEYALWDTPLTVENVEWLAGNSLSQVPLPKPPSPVSAWLLDEGAGSTTRDSVGTNDGDLYGNVAWSTNTPHNDYAGNHSVWFDGTNGTRINFGPHQFGTEGSIQAWVYHDDTTGTQYVMDSSGGARTLLYGGWSLFLNNQHLGAMSGSLIPLDEWTHLVITWDNSLATDKQKVYKNGSLFDTFNSTLNPTSPAMLWLGSRYSNNEVWRGGIDEYALWDVALARDEVAWLYQNSLFVVPEPATSVILGLGGLCLVACGWRKRRRTAKS